MKPDYPAMVLDADAALCLASLEEGMVRLGTTKFIKKRGFLGNVQRFGIDPSIWFDARAAKGWILFYFSPGASRVAGLTFERVKDVFDHAEQRRDMIIKVRLHNAREAQMMVELIAFALKAVWKP